ncbi:MAG: alkaline phosphatase D family protein [bacterium]|nr:alkaline phosphatase D family protein [bacterium]
MKRRDFIRMGSFITISVAALGVTGCNSEDPQTTTLSRPMPPLASAGGTWIFPQSIASGDPHPDSIMLWTRVTPSALPVTGTSGVSVAVELRITTADNSGSLGSSTALTGVTLPVVTVPAYGDFDGTIRHKLTGLTAGTVYYYQFKAGATLSKVGRFKTAPAVTSSNNVKFAFMTCQDWSSNHWAAYSQILTDDGVGSVPSLDFIVHLGDYIYETDSASAAEALHSAVTLPNGTTIPAPNALLPAPGGKYASELADYRYLYKLYRSDARIQAVHERFPMIAIWDDHEFSDDAWQASETYSNANASQPQRRRNANQAWFEFMPADIAFSETDTSFNNIRIYRDMQFGTVMHLIMTDERLYRADHVIAETTVSNGAQLGRINSRYLAPEGTFKLLEGFKSTVFPDPLQALTMLGATQRDWWKTTMSSSPAAWKVWGNEVSLMRMGLNGANALGTVISLGSIPTIATNIGTTAPLFVAGLGGINAYLPVAAAAATVGAVFFGATSGPAGIAVAAAIAIATDKAGNPSSSISSRIAAGMGAGLTAAQAAPAVYGFDAAFAAGAGGTTAQASAGAQTIAFGFIKPDIVSNKSASVPFQMIMAASDAGASLPAGTTAAKVSPLLQKFLVNADQWDGYGKERGALMQHLLDNNIDNVVAITGDIHAFFAGEVYNKFPSAIETVSNSGAELTAVASTYPPVDPSIKAAMVDLVTAGVSSTSFFSYLKAAVDTLDPTNALLGKLVYVPVPVGAGANGLFPGSPAFSFTTYLNLLDYTLGKPAPATAAELAAQLNGQIKRGLAAAGIPELYLAASAAGVQAGVAASPTFTGGALPLAQQLGGVGVAANPWLKYVDTEAQGYAVVTASASSIVCDFKKLNPLVGTTAPANIVVSTKTVTVNTGVATVV